MSLAKILAGFRLWTWLRPVQRGPQSLRNSKAARAKDLEGILSSPKQPPVDGQDNLEGVQDVGRAWPRPRSSAANAVEPGTSRKRCPPKTCGAPLQGSQGVEHTNATQSGNDTLFSSELKRYSEEENVSTSEIHIAINAISGHFCCKICEARLVGSNYLEPKVTV